MTQVYNANGDIKGSKTNDFTLVAGVLNLIDGTSNTVDASFPETIKEFDLFIVQNLSASTFQVRVLSPNFTVSGTSDVRSAGDNLILNPGEKRLYTATSSTNLELT